MRVTHVVPEEGDLVPPGADRDRGGEVAPEGPRGHVEVDPESEEPNVDGQDTASHVAGERSGRGVEAERLEVDLKPAVALAEVVLVRSVNGYEFQQNPVKENR